MKSFASDNNIVGRGSTKLLYTSLGKWCKVEVWSDQCSPMDEDICFIVRSSKRHVDPEHKDQCFGFLPLAILIANLTSDN